MSPLAARALGGYARFVSGLLTVLGMVGLIRTHFTGFASSDGVALLTFTANPLTHVIMLAGGLVGIALALRLETARRYVVWVGVVGVAWGLLEFVLRDSSADIFGRDSGLAALTVTIGVVGLVVWWAARGEVPASAQGGVEAS